MLFLRLVFLLRKTDIKGELHYFSSCALLLSLLGNEHFRNKSFLSPLITFMMSLRVSGYIEWIPTVKCPCVLIQLLSKHRIKRIFVWTVCMFVWFSFYIFLFRILFLYAFWCLQEAKEFVFNSLILFLTFYCMFFLLQNVLDNQTLLWNKPTGSEW